MCFGKVRLSYPRAAKLEEKADPKKYRPGLTAGVTPPELLSMELR
jgi:hypothetical protein